VPRHLRIETLTADDVRLGRPPLLRALSAVGRVHQRDVVGDVGGHEPLDRVSCLVEVQPVRLDRGGRSDPSDRSSRGGRGGGGHWMPSFTYVRTGIAGGSTALGCPNRGRRWGLPIRLVGFATADL